MDYNAIRERQNSLARQFYGQGYCYGWNTEKVWGYIVREHGFEKIKLPGTIRRDKLALALRGCGKILSKSSHHVAGIEDGKVFDSWDSRFGRCTMLYVRKEVLEEVKQKLNL